MNLTDKDRVAAVAGVCLIALVAVLKNVVMVPAETLNNDILIYIIIYYSFFIITPTGNGGGSRGSPLLWSMIIVLITIAIIAVYAL